MHQMLAAREEAEHRGRFAGIARLAQRHAVDVDDRVGRNDHVRTVARRRDVRLCGCVQSGEFARCIAGAISFGNVAWDDHHAKTQRGEQLEAPRRCAREQDFTEFAH